MSTRKVALLLIALMIGLGTVFLARGMLRGPDGTATVETAEVLTVEILVAANDLSAGEMIKTYDLKWKTWPKEDTADFAIKGNVKKEQYIGNVVRYGMSAGEPVLAGRIVKPGEQGFMAAALSPGMRALSIAVTPTSGVAGFIFPGDRVDIIVTHEIGSKSDIDPSTRKVSETMLRNIRVLALDQQMGDDITEPKVAQLVTLEVSPKQAESLALAGQLGVIALSLRSIANGEDLPDSKHELTWDSDISNVLPRPANRSGAVQKIKIIRGQESTEAVYDLTTP